MKSPGKNNCHQLLKEKARMFRSMGFLFAIHVNKICHEAVILMTLCWIFYSECCLEQYPCEVPTLQILS